MPLNKETKPYHYDIQILNSFQLFYISINTFLKFSSGGLHNRTFTFLFKILQ